MSDTDDPADLESQLATLDIDEDAREQVLDAFDSPRAVLAAGDARLMSLGLDAYEAAAVMQNLDADPGPDPAATSRPDGGEPAPTANGDTPPGDVGDTPQPADTDTPPGHVRAAEQRRDDDHDASTDSTDEYGRKPLITSQRGRPSKGSIRGWTYQATVPCWHSDCPHGKRRPTCEWTTYTQASQCPSSRSPHQIRTGAITWMRNRGLSAEVVAKRVNAKVSTIERHYDKADPMEEMLERRAQATQDLDIEDETTTEES